MNDIKGKIVKSLKSKNYIIGAATGSGMVARCCQMFGGDLLFITNSGKFRQNGHSSLCGYMPYENANLTTYQMALKEILPITSTIPVIAGINATDVTLSVPKLIDDYAKAGVMGIANYPTVTSVDGNFRRALEKNGFSFQREVDALRYAHEKHLFTVAFIMSLEEIQPMIEAGADMICVDFGLTHGGLLGARKNLTIRDAAVKTEPLFSFSKSLAPDVLFAVYGGPLATPSDVHLFYKLLPIDAFIGGSSFERIPLEETYYSLFHAFSSRQDTPEAEFYPGLNPQINYVDYSLKYINANYYSQITLHELADTLHISEQYLSHLFHSETGITFRSYLKKYRIDKAIELMQLSELSLTQIGELVGYADYAYFSRMFRSVTGISPKYYRADLAAKKR